MSAQHLTKDICPTREMLCGHCADMVRTYISRDIHMSALYPSSVFSSGDASTFCKCDGRTIVGLSGKEKFVYRDALASTNDVDC